jgi:hypothetical protein
MNTTKELQAEKAQLLADLETLVTDAMRYRWLRDLSNNETGRAPMALMVGEACANEGWRDALLGSDLDDAIDRCMDREQP